MSDIVKAVVLNYITCSVLGGVLEHLTPDKFKKIMRIAVVSVMLFSVFSPFLKNDISFQSYSFSENEEQEKTDALMHIANLTEKKVYGEIKAVLIKNNITEYEIYIEVTPQEEENTVYLDSIKIEIGEEFKAMKKLVLSEINEEYKSITKVGVKNE